MGGIAKRYCQFKYSNSFAHSINSVSSGDISLGANVTSCGVKQAVAPLALHVGAYQISDYTLNGNTNHSTGYFCTNQSLSFSVTGTVTGYNWMVPSGWTITSPNNSPTITALPSSSNAPGNVTVTFTEPCNNSVTLSEYISYNNNGCTPNSPYTISPNPASNYINIYCTSLQTYCNIAAVQITNLYGQVLSSNSWSYTNQTVQMPIPASFLNGTYIAKIYSGTQWYSMQFVVHH